jgi:hypothetical protein
VASPMQLREAVEIVAHGGNDYCTSRERTNEYHCAQSIVDAAVEDIERIPALKLAAYRAGVEAAAKKARELWHDPEGAFSDDYVEDAIRALPDPTPEEMEQIK